MTVIRCPSEWESLEIPPFLNQLYDLRECEDIIIDFESIGFAKPWGAIMIANAIKDFIDFRKERGLNHPIPDISVITNSRNQAVGYLNYMRFFDYIGIYTGREIAERNTASVNYHPLSKIDWADIESNIYQENIERISNSIARSIFPGDRDSLSITAYCLTEVIRNTFEHARIDYCIYMLQQWQYQTIELAFIDKGCGVWESLRRRHPIDSNKEALTYAIKPGISGGDPGDAEDHWGNSGFGLFVLSELCKIGGSFIICSNGDMIELTKDATTPSSICFKGTSIRIVLNRNAIDNSEKSIKDIVDKGHQIIGSANNTNKASKNILKS